MITIAYGGVLNKLGVAPMDVDYIVSYENGSYPQTIRFNTDKMKGAHDGVETYRDELRRKYKARVLKDCGHTTDFIPWENFQIEKAASLFD